MKTTSRNSGKANFGRAILLVALAVVLGSTGCQKEDELMPSTNNSITQSGDFITTPNVDARNLPTIDESATGIGAGGVSTTAIYTVIKIDHIAGLSKLPDYSVIVRSDGWVIYDGRTNVRIKDRIIFRIPVEATPVVSDVTVPMLREVFNTYRFYDIVSDFKVYQGMPVVYTTFQPNQLIRSRTIYDDYNSIPQKLILIRKNVEELLGIGKYVNYDWNNEPSQVQDPLF